MVKINVDATHRKHDNRSCLGIVIRDLSGSVVGSRIVQNNNVPFLFAAEALAYAQGMQLRLDLSLKNVEIEGDSLTVIKKLQKE